MGLLLRELITGGEGGFKPGFYGMEIKELAIQSLLLTF